MFHRLYLLFPEPAQAEMAVALLQRLEVPISRVHAIARDGVDLSRLPLATDWQRRDVAALIERVLWNVNLSVFGVFLGVFLLSGALGGWGWAIAALIVMALTFGAGWWFVTQVPHAHINECRNAIGHGEVLLLIDLPRDRLHEVQNLLIQAHPEAEVGGVGWSMEMLPI